MVSIDTAPLKLVLKDGWLCKSGRKLKPSVRTLKELEDVVQDLRFLVEKPLKTPCYFMYRDLHKPLAKAGLRYDITVLPPIRLGKEFNKTLGHYHPKAAPGLSYCEIYEVLSGKAHYLLQKKEGSAITDAVLIAAKKGEVAVIPPNYGHVTINPGDEPLVMANLVKRDFDSDYRDYVERHGAAFFEFADGSVRPNASYFNLPKLRRKKASKRWGGESILAHCLKHPEKFGFLLDPGTLRKKTA